jgi:hypothetical protein
MWISPASRVAKRRRLDVTRFDRDHREQSDLCSMHKAEQCFSAFGRFQADYVAARNHAHLSTILLFPESIFAGQFHFAQTTDKLTRIESCHRSCSFGSTLHPDCQGAGSSQRKKPRTAISACEIAF